MRHQNCDLIDFFLTLSTRAVLISKQTIELLEKLQNLKSGIALGLLLGSFLVSVLYSLVSESKFECKIDGLRLNPKPLRT